MTEKWIIRVCRNDPSGFRGKKGQKRSSGDAVYIVLPHEPGKYPIPFYENDTSQDYNLSACLIALTPSLMEAGAAYFWIFIGYPGSLDRGPERGSLSGKVK
ncbi:MAG TPA: hypothetical protein P5013_06875 [Methanoregula sp.]|nr:hypothetical protein [Methanoregula sp.]